ncbi:hypothetical protein K438DRAFT_2000633 [Mycena galopus ATCC 62051]|nr:hypothetical protein K438DRAFT_2000633 [Mycena galopus ATCC 62051]
MAGGLRLCAPDRLPAHQPASSRSSLSKDISRRTAEQLNFAPDEPSFTAEAEASSAAVVLGFTDAAAVDGQDATGNGDISTAEAEEGEGRLTLWNTPPGLTLHKKGGNGGFCAEPGQHVSAGIQRERAADEHDAEWQGPRTSACLINRILELSLFDAPVDEDSFKLFSGTHSGSIARLEPDTLGAVTLNDLIWLPVIDDRHGHELAFTFTTTQRVRRS